PANKDADFLHSRISPLFAVLAQGRDDRLLGKLGIEFFRDIVAGHVVLSLLADDEQAHGLDQFGRFNAARAALEARHAGKAAVQGGRGHQLFDLAAIDHGDELMRMVLHLAVSRAGSRAFAALHALAGIDAADLQHGVFQIRMSAHAWTSFTPRASARSSVKYLTGTAPSGALAVRLYMHSGQAVTIISAPAALAESRMRLALFCA